MPKRAIVLPTRTLMRVVNWCLFMMVVLSALLSGWQSRARWFVVPVLLVLLCPAVTYVQYYVGRTERRMRSHMRLRIMLAYGLAGGCLWHDVPWVSILLKEPYPLPGTYVPLKVYYDQPSMLESALIAAVVSYSIAVVVSLIADSSPPKK